MRVWAGRRAGGRAGVGERVRKLVRERASDCAVEHRQSGHRYKPQTVQSTLINKNRKKVPSCNAMVFSLQA